MTFILRLLLLQDDPNLQVAIKSCKNPESRDKFLEEACRYLKGLDYILETIFAWTSVYVNVFLGSHKCPKTLDQQNRANFKSRFSQILHPCLYSILILRQKPHHLLPWAYHFYRKLAVLSVTIFSQLSSLSKLISLEGFFMGLLHSPNQKSTSSCAGFLFC